MTQVIAVDWSGRMKGAAEAIWLARAIDGQLVELENGSEPAELIGRVIEYGKDESRTVVGLDFAFSFPRWYCEREGWTAGRDVWQAMRAGAEQLLAACQPPFWGRPGTKAQTLGDPFRETEKCVARAAKSVFQIGGAGAVGTGSLRGMRYLAELTEARFTIWPFDSPGWPRVIEIYPRLFTVGVVKSRHRNRRDHLEQLFPDQDPVLRERAAGSEDAFDAAVSALVMADRVEQLETLPGFPPGAPQRIEGAIWDPRPTN